MSKLKVCIIGGTGFVGRSIAARLVTRRHEVTIVSRRRERQRDLLVLPTARIVQGDPYNPAVLRRLFRGQNAVINLVGVLNGSRARERSFVGAHVELPEKIAEACKAEGVPRLLHMSALHARKDAPSEYLRTKARGEERVHAAATKDFQVTSFRPSVIFGPGDSFINRFAALVRMMPGIFPLACPDARFQPVYVDDVAEAYVQALDDHRTFGQRYDLCGPRQYRLREIVEYVAHTLDKDIRVVGLPDGLARLQALLLEHWPGKPFSRDNYRSLQVDSICRAGFPELFGIQPATLESVVPRYLGPAPRSRLNRYRSLARRG